MAHENLPTDIASKIFMNDKKFRPECMYVCMYIYAFRLFTIWRRSNMNADNVYE